MKIALLGGGNMARAIVLTLIKSKRVKPADILVIDPNADKRAFFAQQKVKTSSYDYSLIRDYDVLFLAVKPQSMQELLTLIQEYVSVKFLVISIAAGITLKTIETVLKGCKIVRTMPNTPLQIQQGFTAWIANKKLNAADKNIVQSILETFGIAVYFSKEDQMDAITTLSGSGPAYVFYFMEALIEGVKALGISDKIAQQAALQTFLGAILLMQATGESPAFLRQKVVSRKGTTEVALKHLDAQKIPLNIAEAMQKAYLRAKELAN